MITLGQASCLVLDMVPTDENRKKAVDIMAASPFGVTYTSTKGHFEPFALAKTIIAKNPYKYKVYPATPPTSPEQSDTENSGK
ncbi:hypothetical protein BDB00DRAFT_794789 [Zychaea mexicana]|uniref:uncharacterized protein n=1 Tax=Zychaea mexicana TaxID=64656 RepID=UPI0022FEB643|nr:uncharacterized protein BDB00DRAFT_794789 [Zychaea mexicana]KAI9499611.1 hypothetical protein BDB00DRAFT_794789 [Zychaea mexicana]